MMRVVANQDSIRMKTNHSFDSVGRKRISKECKTGVLNSETKAQAKAITIRHSSLRCKIKRAPSVIVANKKDEYGSCAYPIELTWN